MSTPSRQKLTIPAQQHPETYGWTSIDGIDPISNYPSVTVVAPGSLITGDLDVGVTRGNRGYLNIINGGSVNVAGNVQIGGSGSFGTVNIANGGTFTAKATGADGFTIGGGSIGGGSGGKSGSRRDVQTIRVSGTSAKKRWTLRTALLPLIRITPRSPLPIADDCAMMVTCAILTATGCAASKTNLAADINGESCTR